MNLPPVLVAVVDSGINRDHPHVARVAGGVGIGADGSLHGDDVDRLGHGTAVAAAIHEKAPEADLLAVKVFDRTLSTPVAALARAIEWSAEQGARLINLSLGTADPAHAGVLLDAVARAASAGALVVAAREQDGVRWLPGCLPGVVAVELDWEWPRDQFRVDSAPDGTVVFRASGFPRPIPGVPPGRNLKGISFAVANVSGFVARRLDACRQRSVTEVVRLMAEEARPS